MKIATTAPHVLPGPPPPFDPECAAVLAHLPAFPALNLETIAAIRQPPPGFEPPSDEELTRDGAFTLEERFAPGRDGAPHVPLLVCRPTAVYGPRPVIYFIHGGGMISGDRRQGLPQILDCAKVLGLTVVSVEYRLAPETPYPGPVEDCYWGLQWTADHADDLGIDSTQIVVAGESAGGGLAAAMAFLSRDRGGPATIGLLLMAPMLDDRNDSPSAVQMAGTDTWDRSRNEFGWSALLGTARGGPDVSEYAAPARATDFGGLPPVFLDVGSAETFRDEVVNFASSIWRAGGRAELHVWPGGFHGYNAMVPEAAISRETHEARARWLERNAGLTGNR